MGNEKRGRGIWELGMRKREWGKGWGMGIGKIVGAGLGNGDWEERRWLGMEKGELGIEKMTRNGEGGIENREYVWEWRRGNWE
jgi:hypothetical protein